MVNIIKEVQYSVDPADISITAKYDPSTGTLNITFNINHNKAFSARYYFNPTSNIDDFHEMIKYTCESLFKNTTEYEFEEMLSPSELMKGKNIHRRIKTVYTKSGKTLWGA